MKLPSALSVIALAGVFGACEKHPVSQLTLLEPAHHEAGGHPAEGEALAPNEKIPAQGETGSQAAPKYFQDKK